MITGLPIFTFEKQAAIFLHYFEYYLRCFHCVYASKSKLFYAKQKKYHLTRAFLKNVIGIF